MTSGCGSSVEFRDIEYRYPQNDQAALTQINLRIEPGETLVIVGPSGCGKSTLLRCVNRLMQPQHGTIELDGKNIAQTDAVQLRRQIGYVVQGAGLFPHLSVFENIAVVPRLLGWDATRITDRVHELLSLVRLEPTRYAGRRPRMLSGGEAQRVGVARALAAEPRLLLMDEPFGALDPVVRAALQREIFAILNALHTTTIFVTHDVEEALLLADRIVVMDHGRIAQIAAPLQVLQQPASAYVADFFSTTDLLRRLSLIEIRNIAYEREPATVSSRDTCRIDASQNLRDALNLFLQTPQPSRLLVMEDGVANGTLDFAAVARAVHVA